MKKFWELRALDDWMFSLARFQRKDISCLVLPSFVMMDPNNFEPLFCCHLLWVPEYIAGFFYDQVYISNLYSYRSHKPYKHLTCLKTSNSCPACSVYAWTSFWSRNNCLFSLDLALLYNAEKRLTLLRKRTSLYHFQVLKSPFKLVIFVSKKGILQAVIGTIPKLS